MQFIDLQAQYQALKEKIDTRIHRVLNHGKYIMGPEVAELEHALAEFSGVKHVVTCANGTDALTLALMASGVGKGHAVFCPTFTFFASAEVISFANANPVFVDIDPQTYNICVKDLEEKIKLTLEQGDVVPKAIVAVDLFGQPADYPALRTLADRYNLVLIEDAAQGFGGAIGDKRAGSFGDIATTSFFPAKPLGCYGDGGAVFTDNDDYAALLRSLRVHGKGKDKYDNVRIGVNSRLDTIQAAILIEKLAVFPAELQSRQRIAERYSRGLSELYSVPYVPAGYSSAWAQYTLQDEHRDSIMSTLKSKDIPSMIYYATCMHQQTAFKDLPAQSLVQAELAANQVFSLPFHPYLSDEQVDKAIEILNSIK